MKSVHFIIFIISLVLTVLGIYSFGVIPAMALFLSILLHELGHWTWFMLRGEQAFIAASPFAGICMPMTKHNTKKPTLFAQGLLLLAGCGLSFLVAFFIWVIDLASFGQTLISGSDFWVLLFFFLIINNLVNLLLYFPGLLDGARFLAVIQTGHGYGRTVFFIASSLFSYALLTPVIAILFIGMSIWLGLPEILPRRESSSYISVKGDSLKLLPGFDKRNTHNQLLSSEERRILLLVFGVITLGSLVLLILQPQAKALCWNWLRHIMN